MATFADLKADVINLINRTDCTDTLSGTFVNQAMRNIARTLRIPSLESKYTATVGTSAETVFNTTTQELSIPGDFLETVYLYTDDRILQRVPLRQFIELTGSVPESGKPRYYTRIQNNFVVKPAPSAGTVINLIYHSDPAELTNNTDTNILSIVAPDLVVYGALLYACDYFNDQRKEEFGKTYAGIYQAVEDLNNSTDMATSDSAIQPSFNYEPDLFN